MIFASIYSAAHPSVITSIIKYMYTVCFGASRTVGLSWKNYGIQLRLKKEKNSNMSWAVVDQELWLMYVNV